MQRKEKTTPSIQHARGEKRHLKKTFLTLTSNYKKKNKNNNNNNSEKNQDMAMYKRDKKIITVSSKLIRGIGTSFKHSHQAVSSFTILSLNMAKMQNQEVRCSFDKNNKTVKTVQHLPQFTLSDSQVFKHAQYSPHFFTQIYNTTLKPPSLVELGKHELRAFRG